MKLKPFHSLFSILVASIVLPMSSSVMAGQNHDVKKSEVPRSYVKVLKLLGGIESRNKAQIKFPDQKSARNGADWSRVLEAFLTLNHVEAYEEGNPCMIAGWIGTFRGGYCRLPSIEELTKQNDGKPVNPYPRCANGGIPCNPQMFGSDDTGSAFCAAKGQDRMTMECFVSSFKSAGGGPGSQASLDVSTLLPDLLNDGDLDKWFKKLNTQSGGEGREKALAATQALCKTTVENAANGKGNKTDADDCQQILDLITRIRSAPQVVAAQADELTPITTRQADIKIIGTGICGDLEKAYKIKGLDGLVNFDPVKNKSRTENKYYREKQLLTCLITHKPEIKKCGLKVVDGDQSQSTVRLSNLLSRKSDAPIPVEAQDAVLSCLINNDANVEQLFDRLACFNSVIDQKMNNNGYMHDKGVVTGRLNTAKKFLLEQFAKDSNDKVKSDIKSLVKCLKHDVDRSKSVKACIDTVWETKQATVATSYDNSEYSGAMAANVVDNPERKALLIKVLDDAIGNLDYDKPDVKVDQTDYLSCLKTLDFGTSRPVPTEEPNAAPAEGSRSESAREGSLSPDHECTGNRCR